MTVITAKPVAAPKAFAFKGKGKEVRTAALAGLPSLAYAEGQSRAAIVTQLRLALGNKPTADEVEACRISYVAGRVAARITDADGAKGMDVAARLAFARQLVTQYAAPVKDGTKPNKLRAGQIGRRTVSQHKAVRASDEAWSQVKAEALPEVSNAKTQNARNTAKRNPSAQMAGSTAKGKNGKTAPNHTQLVKAEAPKTKADACQHVMTQAASLLAFCNKYAGLLPTEYGASVKRFHGAITQLQKDAS